MRHVCLLCVIERIGSGQHTGRGCEGQKTDSNTKSEQRGEAQRHRRVRCADRPVRCGDALQSQCGGHCRCVRAVCPDCTDVLLLLLPVAAAPGRARAAIQMRLLRLRRRRSTWGGGCGGWRRLRLLIWRVEGAASVWIVQLQRARRLRACGAEGAHDTGRTVAATTRQRAQTLKDSDAVQLSGRCSGPKVQDTTLELRCEM